MGQILLSLLLLPGASVAEALALASDDSRDMVRLLVNMLFWNLIGLSITVAIVA